MKGYQLTTQPLKTPENASGGQNAPISDPLLALRAASPLRGKVGSAGLAGCPLFDPGLGL